VHLQTLSASEANGTADVTDPPERPSAHERIRDLSPDRRAILENLLARVGARPTTATAIQRRSPAQVAPLSFAQERLWFIEQLAPGTAQYNLGSTYRIRNSVDSLVLEQSLNEVVRRHESLRTTFKSDNGQPFQVISPELKLSLWLRDLRDLPSSDREAEAERLAQDECSRLYDLTHGPLVRAGLLRLDRTDYLFFVGMHHLISDGWSMDIFWNELSTIWNAYSCGEASPLEELPIQYADFAIWERNSLRDSVLEDHLSYWRDQLRGVAPLQLPADHPRPAEPSHRGAVFTFTLSPSLVSNVRAVARAERATLFMTLLAAFQTLLFRYTGEADIVVGTFTANRNRTELESLIGFFVNTLVIRTEFDGAHTFRDVLRRVRRTTLDAYAHQDLPFARLVQELQPERHLSQNPLFQVAFQLLNMGDPESEGTSREIFDPAQEGEVHAGSAIFDLTLTMTESPHGLDGQFEYSTDLFDAGTIDRLASCFRWLLGDLVANPDQCLQKAALLSEADVNLVRDVWNATAADYPADDTLVCLFERQAARTPGACALQCGEHGLTWAELNSRANQLARYLRGLGVHLEMRVGLFVERSIDMFVGMLAILKAGAAYVPLDPAYPQKRLAYMMEDADLAFVVTQQDLVARLPEHQVHAVCVDDRRTYREVSVSNLDVAISPDNLAYLIYTSGSTGRPKGVEAAHRGAVNRIAWTWKRYPFEPGEVCCARTSLSFVDSVWETLGSLLAGVRTIVVPSDATRDLHRLVAILGKEHATRIVVVPSMLRALLEGIDDLSDRLPRLKYWFTSGEILPPDLCRQFQELMPGRSFVNLYGSSEVAGDATFFEVGRHAGAADSVPIGRPIDNMRAYIVDAYMQPVPVGVPGELLVGGVGVARGYHNLPDLTSAKFVLDPFSLNGAGRVFRTGDLGRYLPTGDIQYLGRVDHQVKIRGFRVELAEIEAVLAEHAAVHEAAVVLREDAPNDQRLVAYVVASRSDGAQLHDDQELAERVEQWQEIWEAIYAEDEAQVDGAYAPDFWNSSYTDLPLSSAETAEWIDQVVARVQRFKPRRVLDVGCGLGQVLLRVAAQCERYCATDFSPTSLGYVQQRLDALEIRNVELFERAAGDFQDFEPASFDAVVINSVLQYMPDAGSLVRLLKNAAELVAPGGSILVGDVRSLPLHGVFHASVELHRAPNSLSIGELRHHVQQRVQAEKELLIDPAFFLALQREVPNIRHVDIEPKRGRYRNELTRFRYEVVLHIGSEPIHTIEPATLDWSRASLDLTRLREIVQSTEAECLLVSHIPNARLVNEIQTWGALNSAEAGQAVAEVRRGAADSTRNGVDPEDVYQFEQEVGCSVQLRWSGPDADGCFDAVFRRKTAEDGPLAPCAWPTSLEPAPWAEYANDPLASTRSQLLTFQLRKYMQDHLPEHMVPSAFMLLETFPRTPSGKLDRSALPKPDRARPLRLSAYVGPRTRTEEQLAAIWTQVLGTERIGVFDSFFELGGHSLLAVRVASRVRETFNVDLPLRQLFDGPTIADLGVLIDQKQADVDIDRTPKIERLSREAYTMTLLSNGDLDVSGAPAPFIKTKQSPKATDERSQ
jgi:amino acid adenylation domain-containing protein